MRSTRVDSDQLGLQAELGKCEPATTRAMKPSATTPRALRSTEREHNDRGQDPGSIGCGDCGGAEQQPHRLEAGHHAHE
jgi:hypothetical protein